jgi:hypothetical protein
MDEHRKNSLRTFFVIAAGVTALGRIFLQALRWSDQEKSRANAARRERTTTEQAFREFLYPASKDRTLIL